MNAEDFDPRELAEMRGEHVGWCRVHHVTVVDNFCPDCESEACDKEWFSMCCDAIPLGELDLNSILYGGPTGLCSTCRDQAIFREEIMS